MNNYNEYLNRKQHEYGDKFDPSDLSKQFVQYYENQKRIKIQTSWGDTISGTVGITTGWKPVFILMRRKDSHGSSDLLSDKDKIISEVPMRA